MLPFVATLQAPSIGHVMPLCISYVAFTQFNVVNHTKIDLSYFPFKTLTWISAKHAIVGGRGDMSGSRLRSVLVSWLSVLMLCACGGSGGGGSNDQPPPTTQVRSIGGSVRGLDGQLALNLNGDETLRVSHPLHW